MSLTVITRRDVSECRYSRDCVSQTHECHISPSTLPRPESMGGDQEEDNNAGGPAFETGRQDTGMVYSVWPWGQMRHRSSARDIRGSLPFVMGIGKQEAHQMVGPDKTPYHLA